MKRNLNEGLGAGSEEPIETSNGGLSIFWKHSEEFVLQSLEGRVTQLTKQIRPKVVRPAVGTRSNHQLGQARDCYLELVLFYTFHATQYQYTCIVNFFLQTYTVSTDTKERIWCWMLIHERYRIIPEFEGKLWREGRAYLRIWQLYPNCRWVFPLWEKYRRTWSSCRSPTMRKTRCRMEVG